MDRTRSYYCSPELSYGVASNTITPNREGILEASELWEIMCRNYEFKPKAMTYFASSCFDYDNTAPEKLFLISS